jgi:hypothetical protein
MRDDMFFIPLIADAFRQPDPRAALGAAFRNIQTVGREPRFRTAIQQFVRFMASARQSLTEAASDEASLRIPDGLDRVSAVELAIVRADRCLATFPFDQRLRVVRISSIDPGHYQLRTDTGRTLWERELGPQDVLWSMAFPGQNLAAAADTDEAAQPPTYEISLMRGTVVLRVLPGFESGSLEITLPSPE